MAFQCKNCGGDVLFDAATQTMRCQYCKSVFKPEEYRIINQSAEKTGPEPGLSTFTCNGCGAELQGTEESRVGFCPYCGGQSLLQTASGGRNLTESIIPFQVTREECAARFHDYTKTVRYLPRELKNAAHLQSFTGIYMPYYEYDVQLGASQIKGKKTVESNSRYEVINTYQIDAQVEGDYCGVPYDASRYLDDEIAARILPFDKSKERPFQASYLSGFYADASTVKPEVYTRDAQAQAAKDIIAEVGERVLAEDGITVDAEASTVEAHTRGYRSALLPMWFLTWRKNDRVAYAVVNGESGKVVTDLPVDMRSFAIGCGVIAAALFAVLELLFQPTPLITSVLSLIAGTLMALAVRNAAKRIFEKQTHANDKGWTSDAQPDVQQTGQVKQKKKKQSGFPVLLAVLIGVSGVFYAFNFAEGSFFPVIIAAAAAVISILAARKVAGWQSAIPEKQPLTAILLVLAAVLINAVIVLIEPASDLWYYLGDAVCILILVLASVFMMRVYNIGTMRPLPKLFDRKEVR